MPPNLTNARGWVAVRGGNFRWRPSKAWERNPTSLACGRTGHAYNSMSEGEEFRFHAGEGCDGNLADSL